MLELETIISKYGEIIVFHLLEKWERYQGIRQEPISIEARWSRFIQNTDHNLAEATLI